MTPVLMAVCLLAGLVVGLRLKHRRFLAERRRCGELEAKVDMYDRNALRTDHDVAGPVTPKPRFHDIDPDEPFDDAELLGPDQLAEMRTYSLDEVIDELGFTQAEIDAADDDERQCNNCGKPPVFAWKRDGFPFAACNLCISLWFEDGLPEDVERLDADRLQGLAALAEVVIPGAVVEVAQPTAMWCAKSVEGWCAVLPDKEPEEGSDWVETVCTYGITLPGGYAHREPTCPDCRAMLAAHPLCAVVPVPECPWAECPHPDRCDTGCRWGEEANRWAEVIHSEALTENDLEVVRSGFHGYEGCPSDECTTPFHCSERGDCRRWPEAVGVEDGPETLPRVLPEGRID